jgi:hypothetical protein
MRPRITKENRQEIKTCNVKELENDYRVMVMNRGTPTFIHYDSESALKEGLRLCNIHNKKVVIIKGMYEIKPEKVK